MNNEDQITICENVIQENSNLLHVTFISLPSLFTYTVVGGYNYTFSHRNLNTKTGWVRKWLIQPNMSLLSSDVVIVNNTLKIFLYSSIMSCVRLLFCVTPVNSIDCEMMPMNEKAMEDLCQAGPRPILPYSSMFIFGQANPWVTPPFFSYWTLTLVVGRTSTTFLVCLSCTYKKNNEKPLFGKKKLFKLRSSN